VRVKKAQTPARSMRYLLSVDRTLRRISLKKIPVRVKRATKRVRSRRVTKDASQKTSRSKSTAGVNPWTSPRAIALMLVGAVAAAALIGAPSFFQRADPTTAAVQPAIDAPPETAPPAPMAPQPDITTTAAQPAAAPAAAPRPRTDTAPASTKRVESARTPAVESTGPPALTLRAEPAPHVDVKPSAEPTATAVPHEAAAVTISGCLQAADDGFWLKDTSGADAPKSRSWKSGFLKKHTASVEIVATTDTLKLSNYAGQRVAATGTLADRRMQAHSLQRVGASCN
jgi:hypothetical protein